MKDDACKAEIYFLFLKKRQSEKEGLSKVKKHENAYKKNSLKFIKDACNGELDKDKVQPKLSKKKPSGSTVTDIPALGNLILTKWTDLYQLQSQSSTTTRPLSGHAR